MALHIVIWHIITIILAGEALKNKFKVVLKDSEVPIEKN